MIETNNELKIELAPASSHAMRYNEAVLYCFILEIDGKIGWRIPTRGEYLASNAIGWYVHDKARHSDDLYSVTPVRDLKDD